MQFSLIEIYFISEWRKRMKKYDFKQWIKAAGVRAIKTIAQTAVAMIPIGISVTDVGWAAVAGTSALAGVVSLLTSIAGLPELETSE